MAALLVSTPDSKFQAIRTKYSSSKLMRIAEHPTVQAFISANKEESL